MKNPFSLFNEYQCDENYAQAVLKTYLISDIQDNCVCNLRWKKWNEWIFHKFIVISNSIFCWQLFFDVCVCMYWGWEGGIHEVTQRRFRNAPFQSFYQSKNLQCSRKRIIFTTKTSFLARIRDIWLAE